MHPRSCYIIYIGLVLFFITVKSVVVHNYENHREIDHQFKAPDIRQWKSQPVISPGCPQLCMCKKNAANDIISVDCSRTELTTVPDLPDTTVDLSLEDNSISNISCESFKRLPNLEILNLASNKIKHLSPCVFQSQSTALVNLTISDNKMKDVDVKLFQNLSYLQNLDLSFNAIKHLVSRTFSDLVQLINLNLSFNHIKSIAPDAFMGLYSLKNLSLLNNRLDHNESFHKDVFQDLGALEMLDVKANLGSIDEAVSALRNVTHLYMQVYHNYQVLGPGFRQLTNLRVLNLNTDFLFCKYDYKQYSDCYLDRASWTFFENIRTVKNFELYLQRCHLTMTGNNIFLFPSTLVTLDLSLNEDMNFGMKSIEWTKSLINMRINYLDLSYTTQYCPYQSCILHKWSFNYIAKTNLTILVLKKNKYGMIEIPNPFPNTIEKLDISDNYAITLETLYDAFVYSYHGDFKLKELHASGQQRIGRTERQISRQTSLSNITGVFPPAAVPVAKLPEVFSHTKRNWSKYLKEQDSDLQIADVYLPAGLEAIYANSSVGSYFINLIPHIRIVNNTVLRHVELAGNPLKALLGPVENVPSLQYLDLSRNQCTNLSVDFFKYMLSLQTLILSQNSLKDLSRSAFINNKNMESLDLSNNQLSEFQPTISTILNMSFLNLSGNLLPGLNEQTCEELKLMKSRNKNFIINLVDNRLLFTCDYLPFLYLVFSKPQIFYRVEDLQFQSTNGAKFSYKDLVHHFPLLSRECLAQRFFILILIIFFVVVSTEIICAVIYHKRWKLRYLYYIGRRRRHIGEHVVDYAPDANVFITYDQDDLRWRRFMQQTFLPGLNQRDITHVLGETDFPGGDLMAHVTGAVVGTRKTVVLLSVDIFDDHHREYEMNLSIMREMDTRSLKIIPIFVEEVDLSLYPREIELFLRHQWERCLRYSDTDDFWRGFLDAVRENN